MKYLPLLVLFLGLPLLAFAQETGFVSLTNAPFLEDAGNAESLPDFLNDIYRICIGAAAVIAVLQIMRAGIMYMGGDSVTEKKEAKNLIAMSIGGLILVLSPVVVFSIINPDILDLKIDGIEDLSVPLTPASTTPITLPSDERLACEMDEYIENRGASLTAGETCATEYGSDWENISSSCCIAGTGLTCCGRKQSAPPPAPETGFYYQIAVARQAFGMDLIEGNQCIRYEEGSNTDFDACAAESITAKDLLLLNNVEHVVVRECNGTTRSLTGTPLEDLTTCTQ